MSDPGLEENREASGKGFVRERIVNRQSGKRWMRKMLAVGICGIIFGLTAGVTLAAFFPMAKEWFDDGTTQSPVVIPQDTPSTTESAEEHTAETTEASTEASTETEEGTTEESAGLSEKEIREWILEEIKESKREWLSDPMFLEEISGLLTDLGETWLKALVTVELKGTVPDWFDDPVVTDGGECAGMIWNETEDGTLYIMASGMVATDGTAIQVVFADGSRRDAVLCQTDPVTGLFMLKVEGTEIDEELRGQIEVIPLGNSYGIKQGDPLLIIGNTNGYVGAVVPTVVTYTEREISGAESEYRRIDLGTATAEGANGFVLSLDGEILGVITPETAGLYTGMLAISDLKGVLQLLANSKQIPYLGMVGQTVTDELSEEHGLPLGVYVTEVQPGSPAYEAGIKAGDVLVKVGDSSIANVRALRNKVEGLQVELPVTVVVLRAGSGGYQELTFQFLPGVR